jgi:hypothetical protein
MLLLAIGAAVLSTGCATITTNPSQNVTILTDPEGAACTFTRDGKVVGVVNPTPGSLAVQKSHADISVECTKADHLPAKGVIGSKFQAMTLGNIIFGGIIGIAVDLASGATAEYAGQIRITLVPAQFASAAERDAFFDRRRAEFAGEAAQVRERIGKMCTSDCDQQLAAAAAEERAGLERIEAGRASAVVKSP